MATTLLDKLWEQHRIKTLGPGEDLLHVDRFFLHDLSGGIAVPDLQARGLLPISPMLNFSVTDHAVSTARGREAHVDAQALRYMAGMRKLMPAVGIRHFDIGQPEQGIVHVIGPELGLTLPGTTFLCTDSHTCTHGAFGALAWGVGSSDATHILATQAIVRRKPRLMRIRLHGQRRRGTTAKDVILAVIGRFGAGAGAGYAIEFHGPVVEAMSMEERMTLCNMAVELGSQTGMVAPDDVTFRYLAGRRYAPVGVLWEQAVAQWRMLRTDEGASVDHALEMNVTDLAPHVTWGTSVDQMVPIDGVVPPPNDAADERATQAHHAAMEYMGLRAGERLAGLTIQHAFIGSCTNGRMSDLLAAANVVRGRRVAAGVRAWVVPGSSRIKLDAERMGLDRVFSDAGFEWRESGCSMCSGVNGDIAGPGERTISTTNRNFVGRQGAGARTHLASPEVAAASAITGRITDPKDLMP
jgi:3-isopropylmalate/(R)-2-methylmalate dehydratase large subunit